MRRAAFLTALLALALGGCPGSVGGNSPDARVTDGDGGDDGDGGPSEGGLVFTFVTEPAMPADLGSNVVVEDVHLRLREVRAIGDAAPGDDRTSVAQLMLRWEGEQSPDPLAFMDAPAGIYSRLELRLDAAGEDFAYRIEGHAEVGGMEVEFEIEDDVTIPLSIPLSGVELVAGTSAYVTIAVNLEALVGDIDWSSVTPDAEGKLVVGPGDPQIDLVRAGWTAAGIGQLQQMSQP